METTLNFPQIEDNEIIIRTGAAPPVREPQKIDIKGDITAPAQFLLIRRDQDIISEAQAITAETLIISVEKDANRIHLELNPGDPYGTVIEGYLYVSPELERFYINTDRTFSREQLIKLIRFSRLYFDKSEQQELLLIRLTTFTAVNNARLQQESDTRANKNNSFNKAVSTELPAGFVLNMPIYRGQAAARFYVELCFDLTETQVKFWLESVELAEALIKQKDEIFAEQLKGCEGFVIINM